MEVIKALIPDWFEALNDADTPLETPNNRFQNSLSTSKDYLDKCIDIHKSMEVFNIFLLFYGFGSPVILKYCFSLRVKSDQLVILQHLPSNEWYSL